MITAFKLRIGSTEYEITRENDIFWFSGQPGQTYTKTLLLNEIVGRICDNDSDYKKSNESLQLRFAEQMYRSYFTVFSLML